MTTSLLEPGQILNNRYRLERLLGQGGMGQVFLAEDLSSGGEVALKTFNQTVDESDRRRFEREIRTLQTLEHPHIVPFRDLGWYGDSLFYTMEYRPGITLEDVLAAAIPITTADGLDWLLGLVSQICEALAYMHGRRIVHRDIKPSNILLRGPDHAPENPAQWLGLEGVTACVTDFGLVKTRDSDGALTQTAMGTPQYMAPEQIDASPSVDDRSDLYSVGVILYRAAAGRLPFQRLSEALSRKPPPRLRDQNPVIPELLDEIVQRLLEFEPYRRPASAGELIDLLGAVRARDEQAVGSAVAAKLAQPSFCGRASQLALLKAATRDVARGKGEWVSITGERGTGKTWLVARSDLRTHALVEEQLAVYPGSFDPKKPHAGFQELLVGVLRHIARHRGAEAVVEVLGRWGRHLGTLFPELAQHGWLDACPQVESDVPREILDERIFETVVGILTDQAETEPRMFVLEDLQFFDDLDLELFRRLLINALPLPVMIVTTHRPEGAEKRGIERLLKEYRSEERLLEIEVPPFDASEVRDMVASLLTPARDIPDSFVHVLRERTDGVPLYVLHLLNSLWNRGMVELTPFGWAVDPEAVRSLPIPESTRSHFLLVLDELPSQELRVLHLAAVLGTRFSFDVLLELLDLDEFELDTLGRNLVHAGLLVEHQDGFRFQHSFEQEIILERLSRPMFRRLHLRVGKVLERVHAHDMEPHLGEIAEHMYLGGDQEKGLAYLRRAASQAEKSYASRNALGYYEKALELSQEPEVRRDLLNHIGEVHMRIGEPEAALGRFREAIGYFTAVEEALLVTESLTPHQHRDLKAYARLLRRFGEVYLRLGNFPPALENFVKAERIGRLIDDASGIASALVRQGDAHISLEDTDRAEEAYTASVKLYRELPPSGGMAVALNGLGIVERVRGNFDKALEHTDAARQIAEQLGDLLQTAGLLNNHGIICRQLGRLRDAVQAFERSIDIRERLGDRHGLARGFGNLGRVHFSLGDFRRGLEALTRARELFLAIGDRKGTALTLGNLGMLEYYLGDFVPAERYFREYLDDSRRLGMIRGEADALNSLGMVALERQDLAQAEACFKQSLACFEKAGDGEGMIVNRLQLARVHGRQGHPDQCLAIVREVRAGATDRDFPEALAQALRIEAEAHRDLGNLERALECAEGALVAFEEQAIPYNQAVCRRTLAKIYRDMGFYWADQAGKHFEQALRTFETLGARHALAVTQVEFGIFLGLLEEVERAREVFLEARGTFEQLGTPGEIERVDSELKAVP